MSERLPATSARAREPQLAVLLREPFVRLTDLLYERFAERGLDDFGVAHGAVFQYLDDAGTQVAVLARRARITKQSMGKLVEHLERRGYVTREADPADGRGRLVRGTDRAAEVYAVVRELTGELDAMLADRLGPRRLATLRELLDELGAALPEPRA